MISKPLKAYVFQNSINFIVSGSRNKVSSGTIINSVCYNGSAMMWAGRKLLHSLVVVSRSDESRRLFKSCLWKSSVALRPVTSNSISRREIANEGTSSVNSNKKVTSRNKYNFDVIYLGLQAFKQVHGHVKVPERFVVERNDRSYPEEARGIPLGQLLAHIRRHGTHKAHREKLEQLGVDYTVPHVQRHSFESIYSALLVFQSLHGHVNVPVDYEVPSDGDYSAVYPPDTHGLKLGDTVASIRFKNTYKQHSDKLEQLGITRALDRRPSFEVIFEALQSFKLIYGHLRVPLKYIVEFGDVGYSADAWGMKLGSKVNDIKYLRTFTKHRSRLEKLGVEYHKQDQG